MNQQLYIVVKKSSFCSLSYCFLIIKQKKCQVTGEVFLKLWKSCVDNVDQTAPVPSFRATNSMSSFLFFGIKTMFKEKKLTPLQVMQPLFSLQLDINIRIMFCVHGGSVGVAPHQEACPGQGPLRVEWVVSSHRLCQVNW